MITVLTHKRHKRPFKHSKTIYVFTSGRVIVHVQIHSRKKILKGLKCHCKMDINAQYRERKILKQICIIWPSPIHLQKIPMQKKKN
jgi:hypothetical protein